MEAILNFDLYVFTLMDKLIAAAPWLSPIMPILTWFGDGWFWPILGAVLLIPKKTRKIGIAVLAASLVRYCVSNPIKALFSRTRPFALFNPEVAEKCIKGYTDTKGEFVEGWMKESYLTQVVNEMKNYSQEFINKWLSNYHYPYEIGYHYSHGYAFPSGHTSSCFCASFAMIFMAKGRWQKLMGWAAIILSAIVGFTRIYLHVHYCTDVLGGIVLGLICALIGMGIEKCISQLIKKRKENKKLKV